jgi:acetyl esterase/lipase
MKYLQDPLYNTPSPTLSKIPPFDKDFINRIYKDVPPPTSGPPSLRPQGPDFNNPRIAWMFNAMKEGKHMQTVIADGNFDRVDPASLFSKVKFPPTYFILGAADTLVNPKFSQYAHTELKAKGVETELVLVEGAGHGFDAKAKPGDETSTIINKGFEFLKAHIDI